MTLKRGHDISHPLLTPSMIPVNEMIQGANARQCVISKLSQPYAPNQLVLRVFRCKVQTSALALEIPPLYSSI